MVGGGARFIRYLCQISQSDCSPQTLDLSSNLSVRAVQRKGLTSVQELLSMLNTKLFNLHLNQGTMIWGSEPEIIFSTHFMGSVTEWSHLDQMGNFRGWCYTPRRWHACDRILIYSANNIKSFFEPVPFKNFVQKALFFHLRNQIHNKDIVGNMIVTFNILH